jgi:membrane-associated phospholipid phosphatase
MFDLFFFISFVFIFIIAYTRITDYQHHWGDVLVGAIVGSLIAFVAFKFILNWQHYNPRFLPYTAESQPPAPLIYQGQYGNYRNMSPINAIRQRPRY